jgi:hypothetical protein
MTDKVLVVSSIEDVDVVQSVTENKTVTISVPTDIGVQNSSDDAEISLTVNRTGVIPVVEEAGQSLLNLSINRITNVIDIGLIGIKGDTGGLMDLDNVPVQNETTHAITSGWAYTHVNTTAPHTGYRLATEDHTHQTTGAQAGQLDHGLALTSASLGDNDHPQYLLVTDIDNTPQDDVIIKPISSGWAHDHADLVASTSVTGHLNDTDWDTFNNKMDYFAISANGKSFVASDYDGMKTQLGLGTAAYTASTCYATSAQGTLADNAFAKSNVVTCTAPILINGGASSAVNTGFTLSALAASTSVTGVLTATDWNTFNGKAPSNAHYLTDQAESGLSAEVVVTANGKSMATTDYTGMKSLLSLGTAAYTASTCYAGNPLTTDLNFAKYKAIAMACDNGATTPSTPVAGQWFLHTPTGRNVLMMYSGTAWIPITSIGTMTMYVDGASGSNAIDKGGATGADAFATIQYAINTIPGQYTGSVTINVTAGTYAEDLVVRGKYPTGSYSITINGTLTAYETITSCTPVAGTAGQRGTITKASAFNKAVADYTNKLAYLGTDGDYRVIDGHASTIGYDSGGTAASIAVGDVLKGNTSNAWGDVLSITLTGGTWAGNNAAGVITLLVTSGTFQNNETVTNYTTSNADHCTIDGTASSSTNTIVTVGTCPSTTSQSVTIYNWGTIIQSLEYNVPVTLQYVSITTDSANVVTGTIGATFTAYECSIVAGSTRIAVNLTVAKLASYRCYIAASSTGICIQAAELSSIDVSRCKVVNAGGIKNIRANTGSQFNITAGSIMEGYTYGVATHNNSAGTFYSLSANGYNRVRNCTTGVYASSGGQVGSIYAVVHSNNTTTNDDVDTSYGKIS